MTFPNFKNDARASTVKSVCRVARARDELRFGFYLNLLFCMQDTDQLLMSQPRRSQLLAARRVEPVPIPLDSDSDSKSSIGALCEVCGSKDPGVVHVPWCNFVPINNVSLNAEVSCSYCGMDLQPMFDPQSIQGSDWPSGGARELCDARK